MSVDEELVRLGRVIKPHGIRGELVVAAEGETLAMLAVGSAVVVGGTPDTIAGMRPHQGRVLLTLDGCSDRTAAEALRGSWVEVAAVGLPSLAEGEWYADDLVGWTLFDGQGERVGDIAAVLPGSAHDYLQIGAAARHLVPMVREWLVDVDAGSRTISMDLPAGILAGEDD